MPRRGNKLHASQDGRAHEYVRAAFARDRERDLEWTASRPSCGIGSGPVSQLTGWRKANTADSRSFRVRSAVVGWGDEVSQPEYEPLVLLVLEAVAPLR